MNMLKIIENHLINIDMAFQETPKNLTVMTYHMHGIRKCISSNSNVNEFPEDVIFKSKAHKIVITCLDEKINNNDIKLIQETIWCLSNISLSSTPRIKELLELQVVERVRPYLNMGTELILESAFWMLSNILGECSSAKMPILNSGYLDFIMTNIQTFLNSPKLSGVISWFSSNLLKANPKYDSKIARPYIKTLLPLLKNPLNSDIMVEMIWMFNYYLDVPNPDYYFINNLGIYGILKRVFKSNLMTTINPILRIFGKLALGDSSIIQNFLDQEFKAALLEKIKNSHPNIQLDALWLLSNIILTGTNECEFMSDSQVLELVRDLALDDSKTFPVRTQALVVLKNYFFQFGITQREELIFKFGYVDCILFSFNFMNQELVETALICLEDILKHGITVHHTKYNQYFFNFIDLSLIHI